MDSPLHAGDITRREVPSALIRYEENAATRSFRSAFIGHRVDTAGGPLGMSQLTCTTKWGPRHTSIAESAGELGRK